MQKIALRKEGFLFGGKEKEVREPARPISACTILILCNSHKHASKKAKRNPLAPNDDEQGGLTFEIDRRRFAVRLTAPYSDERRQVASELAKKNGLKGRV